MTGSPFDAVLATAALSAQSVFARPATLTPMRAALAGPNAPREIDPDRGPSPLAVMAVRGEAPIRPDPGDNGMGRNPSMMRMNLAQSRQIVTLPPGLPWVPKQGDLLVWSDRPDQEYRLGEPLLGSAAGLSFVANLKG
jgi:hypothetical protein